MLLSGRMLLNERLKTVPYEELPYWKEFQEFIAELSNRARRNLLDSMLMHRDQIDKLPKLTDENRRDKINYNLYQLNYHQVDDVFYMLEAMLQCSDYYKPGKLKKTRTRCKRNRGHIYEGYIYPNIKEIDGGLKNLVDVDVSLNGRMLTYHFLPIFPSRTATKIETYDIYNINYIFPIPDELYSKHGFRKEDLCR